MIIIIVLYVMKIKIPNVNVGSQDHTHAIELA